MVRISQCSGDSGLGVLSRIVSGGAAGVTNSAKSDTVREIRLRFGAAPSLSFWSDTSGSDSGGLCMARQFQVPQGVVRRAFQRLDSGSSRGHPGEVRDSEVLAALRRFDETFETNRGESSRLLILDDLHRAKDDSTRVLWQDVKLLRAFHVRLNFRERIYFTVDVSDGSSVMSRFVSMSMVALIVVSISLWMAGTMPEVSRIDCLGCDPNPPQWMRTVDDACVCVFTVEYLTRLLTVFSVRLELLRPSFLADLLSAEEGAPPVQLSRGAGRLCKFLRSPAAICDLLTVLPYWVETFFAVSQMDMPWLRLFRMLRVSRVFKLMKLLNFDLGRFSDANNLLSSVAAEALPAAIMTWVLVLTALVTFSALVYTVERGDWYPLEQVQELSLRPDMYSGPVDQGHFIRCRPHGADCSISPFSSIPSAMWWTLATITTVGYGDVVPISTPGKVVGFAAILYGTILLGLPIGIIGSQFSSEFTRSLNFSRRRQEALRQRSGRQRCLHGKEGRSSSLLNLRRRHQGLPEEAPRDGGSPTTTRSSLANLAGQASAFFERLSSIGKRQTPTDGEQHEKTESERSLQDVLHSAKFKFEDAMHAHGEPCGISAETQACWARDLVATRLMAGPAMDRLGVRVLAVLSEAEASRPTIDEHTSKIRQAWHELAIAGCQLVHVVELEREHSAEKARLQRAGTSRSDDIDPRQPSQTSTPTSPRSDGRIPSPPPSSEPGSSGAPRLERKGTDSILAL